MRHDVCGCSYSSSPDEHPQHPARNGNPVPGFFFGAGLRSRCCGNPHPGHCMPDLRAVVHVLDDFVAWASRCFEASAVEHGDVAAAVTDQLSSLWRGRGFGDADPPHSPACARGTHASCGIDPTLRGRGSRHIVSQHQRNADHALAADQADFQGQVAVRQRQQRHQGGTGKVDMADRLPWLVEHLAEGQRDRFEPGEQTPILLARDGGEQAVFDHESGSTIAGLRESRRSYSRFTTA